MNRISRFLACFLLFALVIAGPLFARDWDKDPAWVEVPFAARVGAIPDVHGAFPEFAASLEAIGFAKRNSPDGFELTWTGGKDLLVFTGDITDRGTHTKECYDAVMSLEKQAAAAGGRVIALLGNHECLLLNGTTEKWANTLKPPKKQHYQNTIDSFVRGGLDFHQAISEKGTYGAWIRRRPLFAIVNGWLFVHGGLPKPATTRSNLAADYREAVEKGDYSKGVFMNETGPLWHREWWDDSALVDENLKLFGIHGVIVGHTIGAPGGVEGNVNHRDNRIIGIDVGMTPAYGNSKGGGLLMTVSGEKMMFRAKYPDRPETLLFAVPAPIATPTSAAPARTGSR